MKTTRIGIIGGGSLFTPELVDLLAYHSDIMGPMEITLMDSSEARLDVVGAFCQRILDRLGKSVTLSYADNYEDTIKGSDYILIQFRVGGEEARIQDDKIGMAYKIPFVETVSVCGLASFLRTYYQMEIIAKLVKEHAPKAWVMNFSNPSGALTEALHQLGCEKVIGVCNGATGLLRDIAKILDAQPNQLFINWRGLNHLTVVDRIIYKGEDVFEKVIRPLGEDYTFSYELMKSLGFIPNHYLQYNYFKEDMVRTLQEAKHTRAEEVQKLNAQIFELYKDKTLDTLPDKLIQRGGYGYSRSVADLIKGIATNDRSIHYVQVPNGSILPELPSDAFVEIPVIAMDGEVRALQVEPLPELVKGLVVTMKQYEQLLIKAAQSCSYPELLNAMMVNPLFGSRCLSEPILKEVLHVNETFLPLI